MRSIIILRPEPGASRTAQKVMALGLSPLVHPLFAPQPVGWTAPSASSFDAILTTSAHAVRLAGPDLAKYRALPSYAVGQATADALAAEGFTPVAAGSADASAIAAMMAAHGHRTILHIAGTTVAPMDPGPLRITRVAVYTMASLPPDDSLSHESNAGSVILVHSPRAGERLAQCMPLAARATRHLVAISTTALASCGEGWASAQSSHRPVDDDMLALAARLCE